MQASRSPEICLEAHLIKILEEIKKLFFEASLEYTIKNYRSICKRLVYFEKQVRLLKQRAGKLLNLIYQCSKLAVWFVESSEFGKFGHNFPLFSHLNKKLSKLKTLQNNVKSQSKQSILGRMEQNEASPLYKNLKRAQISMLQLNFLKTQSIHQLIPLLDTRKIIFQNPQCISCSEVFIKDSVLLNSNPIFGTIQAAMQTDYLEKLLNCIANQEGGVIIIGAKNIEDALKPLGLKFESFQQLNRIESQIQQAILKIKPYCQYFIQKVFVNQNFLLPKENEGQVRICFRVFIFPLQKKLTYLELTSKNKTPYYDVYHFDSKKNPIEIKFKLVENEAQSVYTEIHQKYKKETSLKVNSHEGILCFHPYFDYSRLSNSLTSQNTTTLSQKNKKDALNKQKQYSKPDKKKFTDAPYFKYTYTSLLVVNSIKEEREISNFYEFLLEKKKDAQLCKAFPETFKCKIGDRSTWVLSHSINLNSLKNTLKVQQGMGLVKPAIKVLPVQKTVQINKNKFTASTQKMFQKKFSQRYEAAYVFEQIQFLDKNSEKKILLHITFPDFEQAIFAYLTLEELNLKPYFTKEGKIYEKK